MQSAAVLVSAFLLLIVAPLIMAACAAPPGPPSSMTSWIHDDYFGAAVASLEERIYLADVIVVARLVSADADTLTFSAVEYLKGTGAAEFTVRASTVGRDTQYDNRDAVLFLAAPDGQTRSGKSAASFDFADTTNSDYGGDSREVTHYTGDRPEGYAFDARNPVWLPAESVGRGTRDAGTTSFIADPGSSVTLSDLRATIAWVEGGAGVPGYDLCILGALDEIRYSRDWETYHGTPFTKEPFHIALDSGLPRGEEFTDYGTHGWPGYDGVWLTGPDADLFVAQNIDDDADPTNGFRNAVLTARPLPGATYRVRDHGQASVYEPCNFIATFNYVDYVVTVTPPAGTVHEAFFDPVAIGTAVGADGTNGVLEPAAFNVGGASATITGLVWESGTVTMTLSPSASLAGHAMDFIALDGSVSLTLSFDDATQSGGTLTWSVASQPWNDGDLLMLRIRSTVTIFTPPTATPTQTPTARSLRAVHPGSR